MNSREAIRAARAAIKSGQPSDALAIVRAVAKPSDAGDLQSQYAQLGGALIGAGVTSCMPTIRVAFLSDSTLDHWVACLQFWLLMEGICLKPWLAPYNAWKQAVMDEDSELYRFSPDVVWFFLSGEATGVDLRLQDQDSAAGSVSRALRDLVEQMQVVSNRLPALMIVNNIVPHISRPLGNYEAMHAGSLSSMIRRYNLDLSTAIPAGAVVFDIEYLASVFGLEKWEDLRLWYFSRHPFSFDAHGIVAFSAARLLGASRGLARKCVVLDLDNTLWGGVIGDDGIDGIAIGNDGGAIGEAFAAFQSYLKNLSMRGVLLAVCSKNDKATAQEPFLSRSGMVLSLEDFVAFESNWDDKASNLRVIARGLNLGLDAFVFIDDNPAERALVRSELPDVAVPELPADPAEFVCTLSSGKWFETISLSSEDSQRTASYHANLARAGASRCATDLDSYLRDLKMHATWGEVDKRTLPRVVQLLNKTNQFNMMTQRYSEAEVLSLMRSTDSWMGWFSLSDSYGDHGLIAVTALRFSDDKAFIDAWVMSCRVFARGMENFIFNAICRVSKKRRCKTLVGRYRPSAKNRLISDLYPRLGGKEALSLKGERQWEFDLSMVISTACYIEDSAANSNEFYETL